jgi:hypothetical protein
MQVALKADLMFARPVVFEIAINGYNYGLAGLRVSITQYRQLFASVQQKGLM